MTLDFNGDLAPGDVVEIDSDLGVVKVNGERTMNFSGDFFELDVGSNTLTYTDSESSRTVGVEVTLQEKYV